MTSKMINLSTGPVMPSPEVMLAFSELPISHRSPLFRKYYEETTSFLCEKFQVKESFILSGSGTLANEAMLQQIKLRDQPGLILTNGEFGERLVAQASRLDMNFICLKYGWGEAFRLEDIEAALAKTNELDWILFCHCETSTGMVNDLHALTALACKFSSSTFVDCMSTVGTLPLDLSRVAMATASSGKGLASIPGLALVFSNHQPSTQKNIPIYLDLELYHTHSGIPFTLSSNLLKALHVSIRQKLNDVYLDMLQFYGSKIFQTLDAQQFIPFACKDSKVFTLVGDRGKTFYQHLMREEILGSHESSYLRSRNWSQLALFGFYPGQILSRILASVRKNRVLINEDNFH